MNGDLYTPDNCKTAYQLNWSLSVFWNENGLPSDLWLPSLALATEHDDVRILEHTFCRPHGSQFLLSTKLTVHPAATIRSVKGRLQYLVREQRPKAFRGNYSFHSVGSAKVDTVQEYVGNQLGHHCPADKSVQQKLAQCQYVNDEIDLSATRRSSSGEFVYNLHLVFVHADRLADAHEKSWHLVRDTALSVSNSKGHLLSSVGILLDHVHLLLGCGVMESPQDVALGYLNALAAAHGGKAAFQFGYYAGTVGPYDLDAVRLRIAGS